MAGALLIDAFQMIKAFCKPRIKVGTEWVVKGQVLVYISCLAEIIIQCCFIGRHASKPRTLLAVLPELSLTESSSG